MAKKRFHKPKNEINIKNVFLKNFLHSFNPKKHKTLSEQLFKVSFKHFFYILVIFFVIMMILYSPKIASLPNTLENEIGNFAHLELNANYSINKVIQWPNDKPKVKIDLINENVTQGKEWLLVSKGLIGIKGMKDIASDDLSNVKSGKVGKFLTSIFVLMLPALIVLAFVYHFLKYLILILIVSLIAMLIVKLGKFHIDKKQILNICFFSSFWLMLGMIFKPIGFFSYYAQIVLFLIFCFLGILFTGSFVQHKSRDL
jgi:hypothetical protein